VELFAGGNRDVRQGFLEARHARIGHFALPQKETFEVLQTFKVLKAGVRDLCSVEIQVLEARQPFEMRQARVRDLRLFQMKPRQKLAGSSLSGDGALTGFAAAVSGQTAPWLIQS